MVLVGQLTSQPTHAVREGKEKILEKTLHTLNCHELAQNISQQQLKSKNIFMGIWPDLKEPAGAEV